MTISHTPAATGVVNTGSWSRLTPLHWLAEALATVSREWSIAKANEQISRLNDYQLNDIGLTRSDLTPDGLASAAVRRRLEQASIDAERAQPARRAWK